MPEPPALILASSSPRRVELLRSAGLHARAIPSGIPEEDHEGEAPRDRVLRLAAAKARSVASRLESQGLVALVLAADTLVALDGVMLGKPRDDADAARMLQALSGRTHDVHTGVFLLRTDDGRSAASAVCTRVRFRTYDSDTVRWYVATGEPADKAGAYNIHGPGVFLSEAIEGSWTNVVGLPLEKLPQMFLEIGVDLRDLLRPTIVLDSKQREAPGTE